MDCIDVEREYEWVINVLNSCVTIPQINVADKLFNVYQQKWLDEISDIKLLTIKSDYERKKISKIESMHVN